MFSPSIRGRLGVASACRKCTSTGTTSEAQKLKARERTVLYRERHKERWRAAHRIHQFKRRHRIAVTQDGSVTDAFLKGVYAEETCFWCKESVEYQFRTLEHIVELIQGGTHTADNITMACSSCNSARKGKK